MMIGNADNPLISSAIRQLYEGALLLEGDLASTTGFVQRMNELIEAATLSK